MTYSSLNHPLLSRWSCALLWPITVLHFPMWHYSPASHSMKAISPVLRHTPPSYCRIEEDTPTSTTCLPLSQVTRGKAIILPKDPSIPSLEPQLNAHLGSGMEVGSPVLQQDPRSCCQTGEDDLTSNASIDLSQVTRSTGPIQPTLPSLPSTALSQVNMVPNPSHLSFHPYQRQEPFISGLI